ncbi:histone-fold-containing protein [Xylariomycetidae sp. FL0641]|nr:histone-fold-containing protein [Xylariomycetidae sp. FL0641]
MPYNTTAIPPRKEVTGQTQLPLSRVKKIIAQDEDINICSNNAAFVITLATEMFIQYIASEGLNMAKLERKPRRNIQYKDLANAVSHQDNLQFLEDIVPKTAPYKAIKAQAAARRAELSAGTNTEDAPPVPNGGKKAKQARHSDVGPSTAGMAAGAGTGGRRRGSSFVGGILGGGGGSSGGGADEQQHQQLRAEMMMRQQQQQQQLAQHQQQAHMQQQQQRPRSAQQDDDVEMAG